MNEELFLERYNKLNEQQREAVDTIYGPVMVIAGPGTGKTEVLSMRIANLLRSEAQVQPHEILCLTYTEEATNAMRRRLVQIIGTQAHRVNIYTFHAFCNSVIQNNSEYFSMRSMQPITDLERTDLIYEMLEQLPSGHALRKLSGNIYSDTSRLNRLFDMMKRENLRAADISTAIDAYLAGLPEKEGYKYKRNGKDYKIGDLKQSLIDDETRKVETTRAAATLFEEYERRMQIAGRYDFNDMILWVLEAFKNFPALLLSYQERHQFILVDEFQDTNGSQNELLNLLTEFWEDANIFVVGDDDQSIYEFQGARIQNIKDFYDRYRGNIKTIVLKQNYRSSQAILNRAMRAINENKERLTEKVKELKLDKNIVASAPRFADGAELVEPEIITYGNTLQEDVATLRHIEHLQSKGVPLNHIAVLYAQHKQSEYLLKLMERKGIPFNVKKPVNILELPLIQQVIKLLRYLDEERKEPFSAEALLFEMLHAPYYKIAATDIAQVSLYIQANRQNNALRYWRVILGNALLLESLNLPSSKALIRMGHNIEQWLSKQMELPLPLLVEKVVYESGIVTQLLRGDNSAWDVQVLHTFFEFVKDAHGGNPKLKIAELLRMLERMDEEKISIPLQKVIQNENGVHFYTAHGAKGNEFEYVFLIGATKNFWEGKRGNNNEFKLPDTVTKTEEDPEKTYKTEVARRLFYVALTRAKKHLYVSYALADNNSKSLEHSAFIDEISNEDERSNRTVTPEDMLAEMEWAMGPVPKVQVELANHQAIDRMLSHFTMSVTSLTKFLRCPLAFYYEIVLQVPYLKSDALAFGSAVHNTLERMFRMMKDAKGVFPSREEVLNVFDNMLFRESAAFTPIQYERRKEQGVTMLGEYYDKYIPDMPKNVEVEFKVPRYLLDGVPITGKIDKMEFEGDSCTVIDYKTGDPDRSATAMVAAPNEKEPNGGDYWRQMVFYKILIENYADRQWKVSRGMFDYIEKGRKTNEYKRLVVPMFEQDEAIVRVQLKDSYMRIMNHEFHTGCGEEDCHWCNFAKQYELVRPAEEAALR